MRVALDTHILFYWVASPDRLAAPQQHTIQAITPGNPAIVADICLWEIGMPAATGRNELSMPMRDWMARAVAPPLVRLAEITPNIASSVTELCDWQNRDPANRLIVATSQVYGLHFLQTTRQFVTRVWYA